MYVYLYISRKYKTLEIWTWNEQHNVFILVIFFKQMKKSTNRRIYKHNYSTERNTVFF
jgi:hypothetical protein